ncbi:mannan-binding lectin serine protease 1 [Nerophis lumbriciformis]|uniref:mannan-binding lectin serine protease 1 n=1 Tax=Nerophis lumbriciformis TaxID=546530 RepID=UPI002ADFB32E|nr:mannan-binding lectin serine protease 1 [Nerophis lumbriciformis]
MAAIVGCVCLCASLALMDAQLMETQTFGTFRSPNFPAPYPPEASRHWNISVPQGFRVRLYFSHFDLEPSYLCEYDYVKVEAEGEMLALFCGREDSDTEAVPGQKVITSPKNTLSVDFSSDFSNEENFSGFNAHYSAVDVDECMDGVDEDMQCDHLCHNYLGGFYCSCRHGYLLHTDKRTCTVECGGHVFRNRSGVVSSVDFPAPYPKSSECLYVIEVAAGLKLRLHFEHTFDVEDHPEVVCPYDYVRIRAGARDLGTFCGRQSPGVIETDSNVAAILFHSDNSGENLGWRLTYTSVEAGSQCPIPERPPNSILSPVQSEYSIGDHVEVTCATGFRLVKDGQRVDEYNVECGADRKWNGSLPVCQTVDCGVPEGVDRADVVFGNRGNSTLFGATVRYRCGDDAFEIHPNDSQYHCGPNGLWVHADLGVELPSCVPACGRPARSFPRQVKRIVGGHGAEPGLFPWQVLLSVEDPSRVPEDRWFGSGALLSDTWVLTAAHVLRTRRRDARVVPVDPEHIKVFVGLVDKRDQHSAPGHSVDEVVLHPDFRPSDYSDDIAMVRLSTRVELNAAARPVCLPPPQLQDSDPAPLTNSVGVVAGWGVSDPSSDATGATSDLLQYVKLPVVSEDECRASYASRGYNVSDGMFCAGFYEGGRDTCLGDSGGAFVMEEPLGRRWAVFGLVSWGGPEACGTRRVYGVYTRVIKYVEWIQNRTSSAPWWKH